ncbi:R-spondin-3-like [Petromyzon marinus]|uniref:R-spondin-3-like n=1 Tax=Petromyzon marinus TaxID=7757 RepID=A0AAJ7X9A9_PETMA|nr:R-spondin-3-like [Petromyzon marinus]XP_032826292.1 R-spondin-3-like [Petromyzon marinus]XP_032826293.1 R-spondin-3-like [Petromyzon marinus]XP_032826294.1 R-spondin-3-like [Petromyzon marinus]XP_032826295.1 R-spondin-3-like [Petromyzon marinus]
MRRLLALAVALLLLDSVALAVGSREGTTQHLPYRTRRSLSAGRALLSCPRGCSVCSAANGCLLCAPRLFFHLQRVGMRHLGQCLLACPAGHYGQRNAIAHRCMRCQVPHCDSCFGHSFCTRCSRGHFLYRGHCGTGCPIGHEGDNRTQDCLPTVDCEVSPWGPWSACERRGRTCGYKWGAQERRRSVTRAPSPHGQHCPPLQQAQRCRVQPRFCPGDELGPLRQKMRLEQKRRRGFTVTRKFEVEP